MWKGHGTSTSTFKKCAMKLQILTYNVCGTNIKNKVVKLGLHLQWFESRANLMLFQEHKFQGEKVMYLRKNIWKEICSKTIEVSNGYKNHIND
jgi:hypothetical protein